MQTNRIISQSPNPTIVIERLKTDKSVKEEEKEYTFLNKIALDVCKGLYGNIDTGRKQKLKAAYPNISFMSIQSIVNEAGGNPDNIPYTLKTSDEKKYVGGVEFRKEFSVKSEKVLQSYNFSLSKSDVDGSFSLVFYPESQGRAVFDEIEKLDIVKIYERKLEIPKYDEKGFNLNASVLPDFIGIVKRKKVVTQATESGAMKRLVVSGISAAGVISQFFINLDTTAMAITKQFLCTEENRKKLSLALVEKDKPLEDVISKIWTVFKDLAAQCGTVAIQYLIDEYLTSDVFECDDTNYKFPIGNIPLGEQTQNFYSLINGVVSEPVYEKFATMDYKTGKMKIVVRQVPFSEQGGNGTAWTSLDIRELETTEVKGFDLEESDDEVYTVFFSYLSGYPINTEKLMRIIALEEDKLNPMIKYDKDKYQIYGYRPLIASFNGYAGDIKEDNSTDQNLAETNKCLMGWFGKLDEMLSGSITLAMTYNAEPILPGQRVKFLGGEFYVEGVTHSWNYGAGGDITVSVSRGGEYDTSGKFKRLKNFTRNTLLLERKADAVEFNFSLNR